MKRRLCPPASTSIRRRLLFTDPLTGTLYRLQVVACSLETWAERLRGRQGPSAARQDETTWSLAGERLQAIECVLADHLVPAKEILLRAFHTPETVLQAEFDAALKDYAETRHRLDGALTQTAEVPHE